MATETLGEKKNKAQQRKMSNSKAHKKQARSHDCNYMEKQLTQMTHNPPSSSSSPSCRHFAKNNSFKSRGMYDGKTHHDCHFANAKRKLSRAHIATAFAENVTATPRGALARQGFAFPLVRARFLLPPHSRQ
jgi:hypothetical protein